MEWTQLKVTCASENLETVSAVLSMLDNGLMIDDLSDIYDNIHPEYGEIVDDELISSHRDCSVSIFVPENRSLAEYLSFVKTRLLDSGIDYEIETLGYNEEQWADSWKQYYKTIKLGEHLVIVPMWEKYNAEKNDVVVRMDPGMAFGTGTHETTRLCAVLLEKYLKPGDYVLDVGTGSGILGISASKLGASAVHCYDIDPVAVKVALSNISDNGVENNVDCAVSDLLKDVDLNGGQYDFVCANIIADILLRLAPDVSKYMKPGAMIACSGIIEPQYEQVKEAFLNQGFTLVDKLSENDWNAILFKKI